MQAPNLVQLEGWVHRFRDINSVMRAKGYGKEAIKYFKACVSYLLTAKSKQAMHDKFRYLLHVINIGHIQVTLSFFSIIAYSPIYKNTLSPTLNYGHPRSRRRYC